MSDFVFLDFMKNKIKSLASSKIEEQDVQDCSDWIKAFPSSVSNRLFSFIYLLLLNGKSKSVSQSRQNSFYINQQINNQRRSR